MKLSLLMVRAGAFLSMVGSIPLGEIFGDDVATESPADRFETLTTFDGPMPTGVTVSRSGRIFVNFSKTLVHDPRILWPDTLSVATDGFLYFTAHQLPCQANDDASKDLRQKPYDLFRVPIEAGPVRLVGGSQPPRSPTSHP